MEWSRTYPPENGIYLCKQGTKPVYLWHWYCTRCGGKHYWATLEGQIPLGEPIEWTGRPLGKNERPPLPEHYSML